MKKHLLIWSLLNLLLLVAAPESLRASHLQAGEITYRWVGPNQYRIYVRLYRDRMGGSAPTTLNVSVRDGRSSSCVTTNAPLQLLYPASFDSLGSNLCNTVIQQYNGQPPFGSDVVTFSGIIALPSPSDRWIVTFSMSARPEVSNLVQSSSSDFYTYAVINNTTVAGQYQVRNSSIQFASPNSLAESKRNPAIFYTCVGQAYEVNLNHLNPAYGQFAVGEAQPNDAALNPGGDSVVFSLAPVLTPVSSAAPCYSSRTYYQLGNGVKLSNIQVYDAASNSVVSALWTVPGSPFFSPTWPLPSHTLDGSASMPGAPRLYNGTPYFDLNPKTGRMRFRPSLYNVNGLPTPSDPFDKYPVCILAEEYRKIRLNRVDGQGHSYTKDTTIFVGAVRREVMILVGECTGNQPPRISGISLDPAGTQARGIITDSLTRIVVPSCDSVAFVSLRFEDAGGAGATNNNINVKWLNPFPTGSALANAVGATVYNNNSSSVTAYIVVRAPHILAQTAAARDSIEMVFQAQDQQCPRPGHAFHKTRFVFERRDSLATPGIGVIQQINNTLEVATLPGVSYAWTLDGIPLPGASSPAITISAPGLYQVRATSSGGCVSNQAFVVSSVANQLASDLRIFPNPAHGEVRLTSSKRCQYRIVNVLGQPIVSGQLAADLPTDLNLRHWPSGLYVVHVQGTKPQYLVVE